MMVALHVRRNSLPPQSLESVLVNYLASIPPGRLPGCDGMTTERMLRDYRELSEMGLVPDHHGLRSRHPELRPQLDEFFADASCFCGPDSPLPG